METPGFIVPSEHQCPMEGCAWRHVGAVISTRPTVPHVAIGHTDRDDGTAHHSVAIVYDDHDLSCGFGLFCSPDPVTQFVIPVMRMVENAADDTGGGNGSS